MNEGAFLQATTFAGSALWFNIATGHYSLLAVAITFAVAEIIEEEEEDERSPHCSSSDDLIACDVCRRGHRPIQPTRA